ncbi:DUF3021 domain-containing protein [Fructobacillus cardui]|uniref:DUF3021 domain-containing protein n=1 Tax=Fructobacillus cardui TaxID=2893170 RepID=UPI00200A692D|nr:DUF3021 domain-containing protein [Fructobacillus cardui]MCK8627370.1 DUF3021 domain-containing protein [Fructobacillus cardui]
MKIFKRILLGASLGINIGLLSAVSFSYAYQLPNLIASGPTFTGHFHRPLTALVCSIVLWGLMGILFALSGTIFQNARLSITRRTIEHFSLTYGGFTIFAILAGWFPLSLPWLAFYTLIYLLIYLIIWLISMAQAKKLVHELNKKLQ